MPRSGVNGTYNLPPNTNNQAPNTPISSSMFNAFASDVQQTFNDTTPVAYGGTGQAELVLPSDEFGIKDGSNGTKRVDFDLSGISASTTRTLTIQDSDGTIALLSDIGSLQQDVSDLLNGAVRGDIDQTGKDDTWRDQAKANIGVPLSKEFVSSEQAITLGGSLSISHGLGVTPKITQYSLKCVATELGYSVGDEVQCVGTQFEYTRGVDIAADATTVNVLYKGAGGTVFSIRQKSSNTMGNIDTGNWRLIVRAWA